MKKSDRQDCLLVNEFKKKLFILINLVVSNCFIKIKFWYYLKIQYLEYVHIRKSSTVVCVCW